MINDLNTTSLVYLWSADTRSVNHPHLDELPLVDLRLCIIL